jgi:hypothetical protein
MACLDFHLGFQDDALLLAVTHQKKSTKTDGVWMSGRLSGHHLTDFVPVGRPGTPEHSRHKSCKECFLSPISSFKINYFYSFGCPILRKGLKDAGD